jgi:hypothetical protein
MIHHPKFVIPTEGTAPFAVPERRCVFPSHVFCAMKSLFNFGVQVEIFLGANGAAFKMTGFE